MQDHLRVEKQCPQAEVMQGLLAEETLFPRDVVKQCRKVAVRLLPLVGVWLLQ
jgi:hypothetical protein